MKPRLVCGNKMSLMRCLTPKKSGDRHRFLETFLRKLEREKFQALEGSEILQAENKRLRAQACEWLGRNQGETTTSWETYTIHHTICITLYRPGSYGHRPSRVGSANHLCVGSGAGRRTTPSHRTWHASSRSSWAEFRQIHAQAAGIGGTICSLQLGSSWGSVRAIFLVSRHVGRWWSTSARCAATRCQ